jgi:hypothetical protein
LARSSTGETTRPSSAQGVGWAKDSKAGIAVAETGARGTRLGTAFAVRQALSFSVLFLNFIDKEKYKRKNVFPSFPTFPVENGGSCGLAVGRRIASPCKRKLRLREPMYLSPRFRKPGNRGTIVRTHCQSGVYRVPGAGNALGTRREQPPTVRRSQALPRRGPGCVSDRLGPGGRWLPS